jgi:hypothetical protein
VLYYYSLFNSEKISRPHDYGFAVGGVLGTRCQCSSSKLINAMMGLSSATIYVLWLYENLEALKEWTEIFCLNPSLPFPTKGLYVVSNLLHNICQQQRHVLCLLRTTTSTNDLTAAFYVFFN